MKDGDEYFEGYLFDVYNFEEEVHVWILDDHRRVRHYVDIHHPEIYARGPDHLLKKLIRRLMELDALQRIPEWVTRREFYANRPVRALKIVISRPSVLRRIRRKLYALYRKMDIFHADIDVPASYMHSRGIFPLGRTQVVSRGNRIKSIQSLEAITAFDYALPDFRVMKINTALGHRLGLSPENPLRIEIEGRSWEFREHPGPKLVEAINEILLREDPDIIMSAFGDQMILPALFQAAQKSGVHLLLDRDVKPPTTRKIVTRGSSFNTYGSWIYIAPSYPLFGRWHIDAANSFVYKESELLGIIELSRLSLLPIQRLARASTGAALTNIETNIALRNKYLIPWQKSSLEETKTAYELLTVDKGGLIFVPSAGGRDLSESVRENTAQIDFSQMYPSIMVNHNISPETINCRCCPDASSRVPEANYRICEKRRGIVSEALEHVLARRAYYKGRMRETAGAEREGYESRQSSLKWMLVTSFGYLGFRNAKFGRIESHESVTAFGREKLLTAKEIAEEHGFEISHAITDSLFIHKPDHAPLNEDELTRVRSEIGEATGIEMGMDGVYSWVIFLPSRMDPELPVVNRYLGRFTNGEMKYRGIAARRKDMPTFIREGQLELLELMRKSESVRQLRERHDEMHAVFTNHDETLESGAADWRNLLTRKTASKGADEYRVANGTSLSMKQLQKHDVHVQAGEKIRYLVLDRAHPDKERRYISEELAELNFARGRVEYDRSYYRKLWWESFKEIWQYFAPEHYFLRPPEPQQYLAF